MTEQTPKPRRAAEPGTAAPPGTAAGTGKATRHGKAAEPADAARPGKAVGAGEAARVAEVAAPAAGPGAPLLAVDGLCIDVARGERRVRLVDGFDLELAAGERVALVGESGSGKSVTARALLRLDPHLALSGSVRLNGTELLTLPERAMTGVRGARIGMVFQDPMGALNPLMTIGAQIAEPLRARGVGRREARDRARAVLDELGVANAGARLRAYPHEFSGGMRQRVVLAMALVAEPDLLIADEPTTALDVRVQEQVMGLLDRVTRERGLTVLLITHDLGIVAGFADRALVMYAGRKVEERPAEPFFAAPAHPYTAALLRAVPRVDRSVGRLPAVPGTPPSPADRPPGCAFHPRCPRRTDACDTEVPALLPLAGAGAGPDLVACHVASHRSEG